MKIHKTLLPFLLSVTAVLGSTGVADLKFLEINGASQGIALDSLAISDGSALALIPGGSVARVGSVPQTLQFGMEKRGVVPKLVGLRSIASTADSFILGGDAGGLAVGRVTQSGIDWQQASIGSSNSLVRMAVLDGNLVAITGGRRTFYGSTSNLNSFAVSEVLGGTFLETYINVAGFPDGTGAIVGYSGLIRYSANRGASFVNARPFGSSASALTDAAKFGNKLYVTAADGSVLSSEIPTDLSKSPTGWNWQAVNVSGTRALQSIAVYGDQLVVVGDGGAAYSLTGSSWTALENLPASAKSADLIAVKTATHGEFNGTALIASKSTVYLGTPVPLPGVLKVAKLETCSSNDLPATKAFVVDPVVDPLVKFAQVDWFVDGNRILTNSPSFQVFEHRTGTFKYQAIVRDYRSGVESARVEAIHQVFQNPVAPVAIRSVYEQCASDPTLTLAVAPVEGVRFKWYDSRGTLLSQGVSADTLTYTPPIRKTIYFVEAVATHENSECVSVARTQILHFVYPNPEAPVAVQSTVEACSSGPIAVLAVKPGPPGIVFRWYDSPAAVTNLFEGIQFAVPTKTNAVYFVESVDTNHVTSCGSTLRTPIALVVYPDPAPPVALNAVVEQCASDEPVALGVNEIAGLRYEWFTAAGGGDKVAVGAAFIPTNRVSATYYVESVDTTHPTLCRSLVRTPIDFRINPLPDAPKVLNTKLSLADCEDLPPLEVQVQSGLKYAWYTAAEGGEPISSGAAFTPTQKQSATYYVGAILDTTGCRSVRTAVALTVRPAIRLSPKDVVVRHGDTNTSVLLKVGMTPDYAENNSSTWRTLGDGQFGDAKVFSTTYTPGTNDLASGIVRVSLEVVDSGVGCSAQTASFRIIYAKAAPDLALAVDKNGNSTLTWPSAPGYQIVSSVSPFFTNPEVVGSGEDGSITLPSVGEVRFYGLKAL